MTRQLPTDGFTRIARQIAGYPEWKMIPPIAELHEEIAVAVESDGQTADFYCDAMQSSAQMRGEIPHPEKGLCLLELENPLDPNLPYVNSGFAEKVAQVNSAIGKRYDTPYSTPVQHSAIILQATIPTNYDPTILDQTLTKYTHAALSADRCHKHINNTLEMYMDG